MADTNDIVKVAVDAYHGNVEKYSVGQSMDLLRQALVEANGGSTKLDYRNIRDGKCKGLFSLVEEILSKTTVDGLQESDYFNNLVDFRNVAMGDQNVFRVADSTLYTVSEAADGTQGIRRQRLAGETDVTIPTTLKVVKVYEELNKVLSGSIDLNQLIDTVSKSFSQKLLTDIYALWSNATATQLGGETYFTTAGSYDEDQLLELIAHVEAAAGGKTATIVGTKKAVRNLDITPFGERGKADLYELGYAGKFYGSPVLVTPQRHIAGTTDFVLDDGTLSIIAGDDKPIKCVYEGDPIVIVGDPLTKGDLTQEYMYGVKYGLGIVLAGGNSGIGRYEISD